MIPQITLSGTPWEMGSAFGETGFQSMAEQQFHTELGYLIELCFQNL